MNSIYIHIPFCLRKCNYCDFFSVEFTKDFEKDYIQVICNTIEEASHCFKDKIETIYFGGGTPSVLSENSFDKIFEKLNLFNISNNAEITVEVNPATVDFEKLKFLNNYFNRISVGVQSFNDNELEILGRLHCSKDAFECVKSANKSGFENISLDLMYAIPYQTQESFLFSINKALELPINHLSSYELTFEKNTIFWENKVLYEGYIDETIEYDKLLVDNLADKNILRYEVSNYSKKGFESKHNINYWYNREYLGFGSGAVGYIKGERYKNISHLRKYIENNGKITEFKEKLSVKEKAFENLMLGLRMIKGIPVNNITDLLSSEEKNIFLKKIEELSDFVELNRGIIKPKEKGLEILNDVILNLYTW